MLEKEFKYYIEHQEELVKKYLNKYIVIKDGEVVGDYDDQTVAFEESVKKYEKGTFLIQHCMPGTDSYTHTFHSRVLFSV